MAECMRMIEDNMNGKSRIYLPRSGLVQPAKLGRCKVLRNQAVDSVVDSREKL